MQRKTQCTLFLAALLIALGIAACGGQKQVNLAPPASSKMIETAPKWYITDPTHPDSLYGSGSATSRDLQMAVDKAKQDAVAEIAAQVKQHNSRLLKKFDAETGREEDSEVLKQSTQGTITVVDETLVGARIKKKAIYKESNNIYRAYVLAAMPIGAANAVLMEKIRADERMYTRLRSSETFKDLEQEVEKYRRRQAEQEAKIRSLSRGQQ